MADKSSPKDLEEWLKDKPKEWMQVLANRCALRVMPVLGSAIKHSNLSEVIINQLTLATMRASLTSEVATFSSALEVKGFANTAARVADAAGSTVAPAHSVFVAGSALDLGAARAAGAAVIVSARAIDAPSLTYDAALKTISAYIAPHGKNAADAVGLANVAAGAADTALEHDVRWLQNHGGYEYSPQNLLSTPLWQGTNNPLLLEWGSLKESLKSFDANWQFWIDWYQSKLDGTLHPGLTQVQQDELYYQIATFPNELWEEGAEAVNQRIAELLEGYDGGGKDFFLDDGFLGHDFLTGENQNDRISQNKESSSVKTEQFRTLINSPEFRSNVEQNKVAISFACAGVILQVEEYRKTVAGSNSLEPELKERLIGTLENLTEAVNNIGNSLRPDGNEISNEELEEVASYFSRFCEVVSCELDNYIAPENIGKAVVPTGIILSCGGLGALLGGGIGFGIGGFIGKLITNNLKPKEIVDKIEENIDSTPN